MPKVGPDYEWLCESKCHNLAHAKLINSAICDNRWNDKEISLFLYATCRNYAKQRDEFGRTALHLAASYGRTDLCVILLEAGAELNAKDYESGFTPLHRSIYYGNLSTSVKLLELGADLTICDKDGYSPLCLLSSQHYYYLDLPWQQENSPNQAYLWGNNLNYTLGTGADDLKKIPESSDFFKRHKISLKQVCMEEFHSVFVSDTGKAWVCGHGHCGRLGAGNAKSLLIPTEIKIEELVTMAAVGLNHTLILLQTGKVYSFGSNTYYQLGIAAHTDSIFCPLPVWLPKCKTIDKIHADRYHSVFSTSTSIFSCGLNGGQLGPIQDEGTTIIKFPSLIYKSDKYFITEISTSIGSINFILSSGDLFSFHNYKLHKLAHGFKNVIAFSSTGGILATEETNFKDYKPLQVAILTTDGLYIWDTTLYNCIMDISTPFGVRNIFLNTKSILIVSNWGEAFTASFKKKECNLNLRKIYNPNNRIYSLLSKPYFDDILYLSFERLPNVHRAKMIFSDPKGQNFCLLQVYPSYNLFKTESLENEASEDLMKSLLSKNCFNDITITVGSSSFSAHRFIVAHALPSLAHEESPVVQTDPELFSHLLNYIYTNKWFSVSNHTQEKVKNLFKNLTGNNLHSTRLERQNFPEFSDISFKTEEGKIIKAHKCILATKLDYFRNMFTGGWAEGSSKAETVNLNFQYSVLINFIDYLYTDEISQEIASNEVDLWRLLMVSDQLLADTLKNECIYHLRKLLNLKNCTTMLEMASIYHCDVLERDTMKFICCNLTAILELRSCETMETEILLKLDNFYKKLRKTNFPDRNKDHESIIEIQDVLQQITDQKIEFSNEVSFDGKAIKIPLSKRKKPNRASYPPRKSDFIPESPPSFSLLSDIDNCVFKNADFPDLDALSVSEQKKAYHKISPEIRRVLPPKLSQKEKKKLIFETTEPTKPVEKTKKGWATLAPVETFDISINKEVQTPASNLVDIIDNEREKRSNRFKMTSKSFLLTQVEDAAINELLEFYNADNIFDEKITVKRVTSVNIAKPTWTPLSRNF